MAIELLSDKEATDEQLKPDKAPIENRITEEESERVQTLLDYVVRQKR